VSLGGLGLRVCLSNSLREMTGEIPIKKSLEFDTKSPRPDR
jgi:hypothetical protein